MNQPSRNQFTIRLLFVLMVAVAVAAFCIQKFGLEACMPGLTLAILCLILTLIGRWLVAGVQMTKGDPTRPKKIETFNDAYSASILVARLEEHGIKATSVGDFVSGFQAESPGYVDVVVIQSEFDQAKKLYDQWQVESKED